jgi:hypothetical protein
MGGAIAFVGGGAGLCAGKGGGFSHFGGRAIQLGRDGAAVRVEVQRLRRAAFVEAAVALGYSEDRILRRHILPVLRPVLEVQGLSLFATAVLIEAGLGFVGLSVGPPHVSLGVLLYEGSGLAKPSAGSGAGHREHALTCRHGFCGIFAFPKDAGMSSFSSVDTERLLRELSTRRSEVEALQEVVRLLARARPRDTAVLIAVASILRARFGVKRLAYLHIFTSDKRPRLAYFHNFPSISRDALEEAMQATSIYFPEPDSLLGRMGVEVVMPLGRYVGPNTRVHQVEPKAWWLLGDFAESDEERASDLIYLEVIGT